MRGTANGFDPLFNLDDNDPLFAVTALVLDENGNHDATETGTMISGSNETDNRTPGSNETEILRFSHQSTLSSSRGEMEPAAVIDLTALSDNDDDSVQSVPPAPAATAMVAPIATATNEPVAVAAHRSDSAPLLRSGTASQLLLPPAASATTLEADLLNAMETSCANSVYDKSYSESATTASMNSTDGQPAATLPPVTATS